MYISRHIIRATRKSKHTMYVVKQDNIGSQIYLINILIWGIERNLYYNKIPVVGNYPKKIDW